MPQCEPTADLFRAALDAMASHVAVADEKGTIVAVNAAWRRYADANGMGDPRYGVGRNYVDVTAAASGNGGGGKWGGERARALAAHLREILRGDRRSVEWEYPCDGPGERRWFTLRARRFECAGRAYMVLAHDDVTPMRRAMIALHRSEVEGRRLAAAAARTHEERLRQVRVEHERDSLRRAVASMEQVLAVVAHELRTPLAGMRAMAELALSEPRGAAGNSAGEEPWRGCVEYLRTVAVGMTETVEELLEAAVLTSGRVNWSWGEVDLREACRRAVDLVRPLVDEGAVRLEWSVSPECAGMHGDAAGVRRMLVNLLGNAAKHVRSGWIRVRACPGRCEDGRTVSLEVSDTGGGIGPGAADGLGEAFALNSGLPGDHNAEGTGLGLFICRVVAAAHGGRIHIASEPGVGTTVTATLRADLAGPVAGSERPGGIQVSILGEGSNGVPCGRGAAA